MEAIPAPTRQNKGAKYVEASDRMNDSVKDMKHPKRSADSGDFSPGSGNKKRPAFSDITNAKEVKEIMPAKNPKIITRSRANANSENLDEKKSSNGGRDSIKEEPMDTTLYTTALDSHEALDDSTMDRDDPDILLIEPPPDDVENVDERNKDTFGEPIYAPYVFQYYKSKEEKFVVKKYMPQQPEITKTMRALLVDWMVEVQESFELNHETLYLAVKLVDFYLMSNVMKKSTLQLVGATAVLVASKYDERMPPLVDDFLYICDDSYTRPELIQMEADILRTVDFQLGIPLSYRFLRRYARCTKATMETLTLARFILETSLLDYELIDARDSKLAAAALFLAVKMKNLSNWTSTHQYYSGYKAEELIDLVKSLNRNISTQHKNLQTIRTKYSHKIFFEVSKIPPLKFEKSEK